MKYAGVIAATAMLIAQPCFGADEIRTEGASERRSSAFAGVRMRLPMGVGNPERPSARLQLTTFHDYRDAAGAAVRSFRPDGVELGFRERGRLAWRIGGRDINRQEERLGVTGPTKTVLIIGAVLVAAIVLIPVLTMDPLPTPDFDDSD